MHRRTVLRPVARPVQRRSLLSPMLVGLGLWLGFPTVAAHQDMASLVSGSDTQTPRWSAFVQAAAAGSVHKAEMAFVDGDAVTGSIAGGGMSAKGIGLVAFRGKAAAAATPDETRVNRREKRGRVVEIAPVAPPKAFNAGSVFQRTSFLMRSATDGDPAMALARPEPRGKEFQIAASFHVPQARRPDPLLPAVLVALVTRDRPDVLATAYASAEPDYVKASPFEMLLKDEDPDNGRFVPPVMRGDHPWVGQPLPAAVFSEQEQRCLTAGIYFEARGEAVQGQAAVAQVILNRVRNPTYPKSVCGVVYQNEKWRNRCQFSFACDGIKDRIESKEHWQLAEDVALAVSSGKIWNEDVGSSTHYHATYVSPRWAKTMERMKKIGAHIFYRTYGGGWS